MADVQTIRLAINGMCCAGCVSKVETTALPDLASRMELGEI